MYIYIFFFKKIEMRKSIYNQLMYFVIKIQPFICLWEESYSSD